MRFWNGAEWVEARVQLDTDGAVWLAECNELGRGLCLGDPTLECERCQWRPVTRQMELSLDERVESPYEGT